MVVRAGIAYTISGLATLTLYAYAPCNMMSTRKRDVKDSRRLFMSDLYDFIKEPPPPRDGMTTEECIRYMESLLLTRD